MTRVIHDGRDLQESLQVAHDFNRITPQLLAVNNVELLVGVEREPFLKMLSILARIEATVAKVSKRFWRRITGSYHLIKRNARKAIKMCGK